MQSLFEFDAPAAEATRRRVLDEVATDRVQVIGYHFPFPAAGHIARDGRGVPLRPGRLGLSLPPHAAPGSGPGRP